MIVLRPVVEGFMVLLRTAGFAIAALTTAFALKRVLAEMRLAKATVQPQAGPRPPVKLRQDPVTGIYYPER